MQILRRLIVNRRAFNRSLSYKRPLNGVHLTVSCTAKSRYLKSDSYFSEALNAKGVVHVDNGVQIIYGAKASIYKTELREYLNIE